MDIISKYNVAGLDHRFQSTAQCHNINISPSQSPGEDGFEVDLA